MLNRRILRIKVFKVLFSCAENKGMTLKDAREAFNDSCEATRDLYLYMMSIIVPLTETARKQIDAAAAKFNPTEEERNPNRKFAENALAKLLAEDPDFRKAIEKRKFSFEQHDSLLWNLCVTIRERDYFKAYMASPKRSLAEDCKLFKNIFEQEFEDNEDLEKILMDMSIWWSDDLGYALSRCIKTFSTLSKTARWELPPLYASDEYTGPNEVESDRDFAIKLLQNAYNNSERFEKMVAESALGWKSNRLFVSDVVLICLGLAEAITFPEIPVRVTINEYVEISKYYSTPKSRSFINGILDKLIQNLVEEGEIAKTGKGLPLN